MVEKETLYEIEAEIFNLKSQIGTYKNIIAISQKGLKQAKEAKAIIEKLPAEEVTKDQFKEAEAIDGLQDFYKMNIEVCERLILENKDNIKKLDKGLKALI